MTHVEYFVSLNMCMYSIQCAYLYKPLNTATLTEVIFIDPYGLLNYCAHICNITLVFCGMCVFIYHNRINVKHTGLPKW